MIVEVYQGGVGGIIQLCHPHPQVVFSMFVFAMFGKLQKWQDQTF